MACTKSGAVSSSHLVESLLCAFAVTPAIKNKRGKNSREKRSSMARRFIMQALRFTICTIPASNYNFLIQGFGSGRVIQSAGALSALRHISAQGHAGAAGACYQAAFFIHDVALGHAHSPAFFNDSSGCDQFGIPNRLQEVY